MRFLHAERTHPEPVPGCFGCALGTIGFSSVPGGTRGAQVERYTYDQMKKSLPKYKEARKNGLRPEGTSWQKVEEAERKAESLDRGARKVGFKDTKQFQEAVKANG